ncbi:hypothetical protein C9374_001314 [Naegleria lovaniensis]|uniref:Uncharacterized protein n=1 Tax=Naegleria lovaniensis TaxID=51637 RepID=A0AA88GVK6_NAELO|nr:uncharacterized protein C9374_001314 [Naegleria lovaniensis]KAG2387720.1 hypothetical protein C9374_001314 [Naegleria lovaniensis]
MYENGEDSFDEDDFIFNEYTIDDTLDSLSRLEKYYNSDFSLQRLVLLRDVHDTAVEAGYKESVKRLLPLLQNFVSDTEPVVRQVFAEKLYPLATFFLENGGEEGYNELINTFIPYTFELIIDKNTEVGNSATEALVKISKLIKQNHIEPQLLSVIVNLAHDERVEEYRIAAAKLFNELAPQFGPDLVKEVVVQEIISLSDDPSLLVRKTVSQSLNLICQQIGPELTVTKILPVYLVLSKDEIWGVRKACAESLPEISKCVDRETRLNTLVELFDRFADDVSRWVKMEAYKQLGAFIATFEPDTPEVPSSIPDSLIQSFSDMAFQNDQNETDMVEYCAFNFPAVAQIIGKTKWAQVENAYNHLVKDVQWKVRRSLACSLHEIANLVSPEVTETCLANALELFLKDLDEVKIGVISNLSSLFKFFSEETRQKYLSIICSIPEQTDNWRIKSEISKQLGFLAELVSPETVKNTILNVIFDLYTDDFAIVRKNSIVSCGKVMKRLNDEESKEGQKEFTSFLHELASGEYHRRLIFVFACEHLLAEIDHNFFIQEFGPDLEKISKDVIPNVRLNLAKLFRRCIQPNESLRENSVFVTIRQTLENDKDKDVLYFLNNDYIEPPSDDDY